MRNECDRFGLYAQYVRTSEDGMCNHKHMRRKCGRFSRGFRVVNIEKRFLYQCFTFVCDHILLDNIQVYILLFIKKYINLHTSK